MHNGNRIVVSLLSCCLAAAMLVGCSNSKSRQAGQNIVEKITKAQELSKRAMAMMANSVYEDLVTKKYTPIRQDEAKALKPDEIKLLPPTAVNPDALAALKTAYDELTKAVADNADAPPETIDLANLTLGHISAIMGDYNSYVAKGEASKAGRDLVDANNAVNLVYSQASVVNTLTNIVNSADAELPGIIDKAQADIAQRETKKAAAAAALQTSQSDLNKIKKSYDEQLNAAMILRRQSDTATDRKEGLKIFDQATNAMAEALKTNAKVSTLEQTIVVQQGDLRAAEQELAAAEARKNTADVIMAGQKNAADKASEAKTAAMNKLADMQKDFEAKAGALAEDLDGMKKASQQAAEAYNKAVESFKKAAQMVTTFQEIPTERENEAIIGQASAVQSLADQSLLMASMQPQVANLANRADAAWKLIGAEAPAVVAKLKGLLGDPVATSQAAADKYEEAATLYGRVKQIAPEQQWLYKANQAGAYAQASRAATTEKQKTDTLKKATDLLADALKGRENSPYLTDALRMQKMLQGGGQPAPSSAPIPATPELAPPPMPAAPAAPTTPVPDTATPSAPAEPVPDAAAPAEPATNP